MSALAAPWVKENCTTVGTGNLILDSSIDTVNTDDLVWYTVEDQNGNREAGIGRFNGTSQLVRETIHTTLISGFLLLSIRIYELPKVMTTNLQTTKNYCIIKLITTKGITMKKVKVIRKFTDGTIEESFVTIEKKSAKKVSNSSKNKATKDDKISDSQKDEQESSE